MNKQNTKILEEMKMRTLKRKNPNNPQIKEYADAIRKGEKEMKDNHETLGEMAQRIKEEGNREEEMSITWGKGKGKMKEVSEKDVMEAINKDIKEEGHREELSCEKYMEEINKAVNKVNILIEDYHRSLERKYPDAQKDESYLKEKHYQESQGN